MTTFDSTKASLNDLRREIREGRIQLPDFQRGWVWDDDHIRDLLVSIAGRSPFLRHWCENQGIERDRYDSILNKIPISYKANRRLGGDAPSAYLPRIQAEKQVQLADLDMDRLLESHALAPGLLRNDQFDEFLEDRRRRPVALVERAMGKQVLVAGEREEYSVAEDEWFSA